MKSLPGFPEPELRLFSEPQPSLLRVLGSRWASLWLSAAFVIVGVVHEARSLANPDIAFFLYTARKIVDGGRLYHDVVEINPPLIIALNVPPVLLARLTGWSEISCYRGFVTAVLLLSLLLSSFMLRRIVSHEQEPFRYWVMALLCFALFLVGARDYGQREHLLLALILPSLLLAAARARGIAVAGPLAAGIGILAGLGFALKPHFLLIWPAAEAARWAFQGGRRPRLGLESLALGLTLLAYAGAIVLFTPDYLELVRLLAPDYGRFLDIPFHRLLLSGRKLPLVLLAAVVCIGLANRARHRELWMVLLVAMVAGFVSGAAQQKGWRYHFYPAMATAYVLLGVAAVDARERISDRIRLLYASIALGVTATSIVWFAGTCVRRAAGLDPGQESLKRRYAELAAALTIRGRGNSVFVFSYATSSGFPLVNYAGLEWASRFPQLWLLVATYRDRLTAKEPLRYRERHEMSPAERFLIDAVYQDLATHRPALLVVLRHARDVKENGPRRIDYLKYFARDARISELLRRYRPIETVGEFRLYERLPDGMPPPDQLPPPPSGTLDLPRRVSGWQGFLANRDLLIQLLLCFGFVSLAFLTELRGRANDRA